MKVDVDYKKEKIRSIEENANQLRKDTLEMCIKAGTGHVTSSMCSAEIISTLYHGEILRHDPSNPEWEGRDYFVLSKGQASPILYAALADRGFYPKSWLDKFTKGDDGNGKSAPFGVHLQCTVPGVEFTTGSLGHGLGYAIGVAESAKIDGKDRIVAALLGDGELYEGSNWPTLMYAAHHKINNVVGIIDRNCMCTNGYTEKIVKLNPLDDKIKAFGWETRTLNGHSVAELLDNLEDFRERTDERPLALIANTIKGRGIACMTDKMYIHGLAPKGEESELARHELSEFSKLCTARGYNG